jgi:hypothetical protein
MDLGVMGVVIFRSDLIFDRGFSMEVSIPSPKVRSLPPGHLRVSLCFFKQGVADFAWKHHHQDDFCFFLSFFGKGKKGSHRRSLLSFIYSVL